MIIRMREKEYAGVFDAGVMMVVEIRWTILKV